MALDARTAHLFATRHATRSNRLRWTRVGGVHFKLGSELFGRSRVGDGMSHSTGPLYRQCFLPADRLVYLST